MSKTRISTFMAAHWHAVRLPASGGIAILTEDPAMTHKLTILALDAVVPLDLAIAAQLMGYPMAPYDVTICGLRPGRRERGSFDRFAVAPRRDREQARTPSESAAAVPV
jgi:hypothetical protein